ncbi:MAG: ABC transporter ATP-binding protein [Lautropia sp.]
MFKKSPLPHAPQAQPDAGGADDVAVACNDVHKSIRGQRVLDGVSFELRAGETLAVAGVNGAGKTTLLRCLLDFARADSGSLSIFGRDSHLPQARLRLAYLPERFLPPAHLSGHETLTWLAGLHGRRWTSAQSEAVVDAFGLPRDAMRKRVRQLSKGMTQKLGLAALLHAGRDLIVLDEPMSGLDPLARRSIGQMLAEARARGCTVLFTSHAMADIDRLADRMLVLHQGRQRFLGAPDGLRAATGESDLDAAFVACLDAGAAVRGRLESPTE